MGDFYPFLTPDDIKALSHEEAEILQRVMDHELHTSDDIKRILRQRVQQVLAELKQKRGGSAPWKEARLPRGLPAGGIRTAGQ